MKLWPFAHTDRPASSLMSPRESTTSAAGRPIVIAPGELVGWRVTFRSGFSVAFPSSQCRMRVGRAFELHIEQHGDGPLTTPSRTYAAGEWSRIDPIYATAPRTTQERTVTERTKRILVGVESVVCVAIVVALVGLVAGHVAAVKTAGYVALAGLMVAAIKGILRGMEIEDARRRELEEDGRR